MHQIHFDEHIVSNYVFLLLLGFQSIDTNQTRQIEISIRTSKYRNRKNTRLLHGSDKISYIHGMNHFTLSINKCAITSYKKWTNKSILNLRNFTYDEKHFKPNFTLNYIDKLEKWLWWWSNKKTTRNTKVVEEQSEQLSLMNNGLNEPTVEIQLYVN